MMLRAREEIDQRKTRTRDREVEQEKPRYKVPRKSTGRVSHAVFILDDPDARGRTQRRRSSSVYDPRSSPARPTKPSPLCPFLSHP